MKVPEWLRIARDEIGTVEFPGGKDNPRVVQYYVDAVRRRHTDSVPWCAAFVGACLVRASKRSSDSLMARSYLSYGKKLEAPEVGCVVVFPRGKPGQGHVAFVDEVGPTYLMCIGGNQSDAVTRARYLRSRAIAYRWPT